MNSRLIEPALHKDATAQTLAITRIFVLLIWFVKILLLDLVSIGYIPNELFHPFGMMKLVPSEAISFLTLPGTLIVIKWSTLVLILLAGLGAGRRKTLVATALILTLIFGLTKGFGGHVNHRELVLLYVTYLLTVMPCFDAFALRRGKTATTKTVDPNIYASSMQVICGLVVLNYFFVGLARVCVGFPGVFEPQVMYDWVLSRNVRPNPAGSTWGLSFLSNDIGRVLLAVALPISTLIELACPICLWCGRKIRILFVVALISFHAGIFIMMNILFVENIALLLLFCNYSPAVNWIRTSLFQRKSDLIRSVDGAIQCR